MARYDKLRKLDRNLAVVRYKEEHPGLSFQEIGAIFGVSRYRIYQICRAMKKRVA